MISDQQIHEIIADQLPNFTANSALIPLGGGNLNHLWRVKGKSQNIIIKWAPPHIATNPDVPLSPERIHFEAQSLELFSKGSQLTHIASSKCRPPNLLYFSSEHDLIIMEDVGPALSIIEWINDGGELQISRTLGHFIGQLHKQTYGQSELGARFHNSDIQQTRQKLQYNPAAEYIKKTRVVNVDFNLISSKTKTLGKKLLEPGKCLTMGDLWPPSVLVDDGNLRLIDWEFAHYGRPLQDVGHFAAHCWMQGHTMDRLRWGKQLWNNFWNGYRAALGSSFDQLFDQQELGNMAIHAGCEMLVRVAGPFKSGYVYAEYDRQAPVIQEAVRKAISMIEQESFSILWQGNR